MTDTKSRIFGQGRKGSLQGFVAVHLVHIEGVPLRGENEFATLVQLPVMFEIPSNFGTGHA